MLRSKWMAIVLAVLAPTVALAQWTQPDNSTISSNCTTPPCTVRINAGNNNNTGIALDARGDVIAIGTSTDVGASSTAGPAALWANATTDQVVAVLLRSGGNESVHLRREPTTNDFTIFAGNTERLRVTAGGRVGIGTNAPSARLQVLEGLDGGVAGSLAVSTSVEANANQFDYGLLVYAYQGNAAGVVNTGRIIGTQIDSRNTGAGQVSISMGGRFYAGMGTQSGATGHVVDAYGLHSQVLSGNGTVGTGYGLYIADTQATNDFGIYQVAADDSNHLNGNTGIGGAATSNKLEVYGNANFTGTVTGANIQAKYQDVAEWVPATTDLAAGTVVVLNPDKRNEVMSSTRAYDTTVAGVVSAQPGLILGEAGPAKEQIATTGRVRVRVDARRAPIRIGDLLVTGDEPGTAMRSEPIELRGRAFHQPGTIIGKALEPLPDGTGEILVLLSLQ